MRLYQKKTHAWPRWRRALPSDWSGVRFVWLRVLASIRGGGACLRRLLSGVFASWTERGGSGDSEGAIRCAKSGYVEIASEADVELSGRFADWARSKKASSDSPIEGQFFPADAYRKSVSSAVREGARFTHYCLADRRPALELANRSGLSPDESKGGPDAEWSLIVRSGTSDHESRRAEVPVPPSPGR